jgi:hypothetical protein
VLVTVKGFGGIWERRFGTSTARSKRFAPARSVTAGGLVARSGSTESAVSLQATRHAR